MCASGTPSGVLSQNPDYRGYHFADAPFNPRLPLFEPVGFILVTHFGFILVTHFGFILVTHFGFILVTHFGFILVTH